MRSLFEIILIIIIIIIIMRALLITIVIITIITLFILFKIASDTINIFFFILELSVIDSLIVLIVFN